MHTLEEIGQNLQVVSADVLFIRGQVQSIVAAMPEKDAKPDFFGHRVDHEELRDRKVDRREEKRSGVSITFSRTELARYGIIFVLILVGSGKGADYVATILKALQ